MRPEKPQMMGDLMTNCVNFLPTKVPLSAVFFDLDVGRWITG